MIRAMIVDDEPLAIRGLEKMIQSDGRVLVAGHARSVAEAAHQVAQLHPQLIFLDIQLQGESGFDLLDRVPSECRVIFVTAYDSFAIRAFEVNALDYLLKPVRQDRLVSAINRAMADAPMPPPSRTALTMGDVVAIQDRRGLRLIQVDRIQAIQADGDYSSIWIHDEPNAHMLRSLSHWETMLPKSHFFRIHRSSMVNAAYIKSIDTASSNRYAVVLHHAETVLTISQRYASQIRRSLSADIVHDHPFRTMQLG